VNVDLTRASTMQVLEEHADYLICRGYDPDVKRLLNRVAVAKPHALQKTPWDGQAVKFPAEDQDEWGESSSTQTVSYEYEGCWRRTVTMNGNDYRQEMSPRYFRGEILVAVKVMTRIGETPGMPEREGGGVDRYVGIMYEKDLSEDGSRKPIAWVDLNIGGKQWHDQNDSEFRWFTIVSNSGLKPTQGDDADTVHEATAHEMVWNADQDKYIEDTKAEYIVFDPFRVSQAGCGAYVLCHPVKTKGGVKWSPVNPYAITDLTLLYYPPSGPDPASASIAVRYSCSVYSDVAQKIGCDTSCPPTVIGG
jgi:hypothetical protein